ncbi:MAG: pentapeptide repeat-containing protein, partial [Betaproteobacteria bacterium]
MSGTDSVAQLRGRWTPALTAAALQRLLGHESAIEIPTLELDGRTLLDLRGIRIEQTQLDGAQLRDASLRWATVRDVGFKGAALVGCDLSQTQFTDCYFRSALFERCDIVNARFGNSDFSGARFDACRLDFSAFVSCEIAFDSIRFRGDAPPQVLARVCRNLKLNAMSMGRFTDASDLAYLERTFDRHALHQRAFGAGMLSRVDRLHAVALW